MVKIRQPYDDDYNPAAYATPVGYVPDPKNPDLYLEASLTKQSFADECNINNIMDRWQKTGVVAHLNGQTPTFGDLTELPDFHEAMNTVVQAQTMFDALPSRIRERFANDPANLMEFLGNPKNRNEAIEMGLIENTPSKGSTEPVKEVSASAATPAAV